ncbi:hypothetical protein KL86PLE_130172 [uncultured Pleomorphomonas sp.]|uniref:Uncharacterized protein n=1 Tax=uncultured Pleomorphomonas sp. TaxID=442121 RepID=A0A212L9Y8_9HYPH|nr:hypothetical protein KL86PLE_130172 [uncultured Pleomorphomonas sp.]
MRRAAFFWLIPGKRLTDIVFRLRQMPAQMLPAALQ